jgi:exopolysaccharide production protein ExoZ
MNPSKQRLLSLEMIRALAVLSIVFYHTQMIFSVRTGIVPFGGIFGAGIPSVYLFFVLSGFIIPFVHFGDMGRPSKLGRYFHSRFVRIYPSVWIVTLLALAVYLLGFGGADKAGKLSLGNIADSFLLLPQSGDALVNVTWTLKYEIFFYLLFSLAILRSSLGILLVILWQLATLTLYLSGRELEWSWAAFYLRPVSLEFGFGFACCFVVVNRARFTWLNNLRLVGFALAAASLMFVGAEIVMAYRPAGIAPLPEVLFFGACAAVIIGCLALLDMRQSFKTPRFLVAVGDASYSIYLVHFSTISLLAAFLTKRNWVPMNDIIFLAVALTGIFFGFLFHRWIDQPIHRFLRRREPRRATPIVAPVLAMDETMPPALFATKDAAPI